MNEVQQQTLYVVGTPIGNMEELSPRAVKVLSGVDFILCEDCRHSLGLLNVMGITKPLRAHHKFNEKLTVDGIVEEIKNGASVALITDAGMPCISDPGHILVAACQTARVKVSVVSGACAAIDALVLSGMDSTHFCFVGFLPTRNRARMALLETFREVQATLIFYVPPHALNDDLKSLYNAYGARAACVTRELTKIYEEAIPFTLCAEPNLTARGEYVVIVEGAEPKQNDLLLLSVEEHLDALIEDGMDEKTAIKKVSTDRNISKNEVYQLKVNKQNNRK